MEYHASCKTPFLILCCHTFNFIGLIVLFMLYADICIALLLYIRIVVYTYAKIYKISHITKEFVFIFTLKNNCHFF